MNLKSEALQIHDFFVYLSCCAAQIYKKRRKYEEQKAVGLLFFILEALRVYLYKECYISVLFFSICGRSPQIQKIDTSITLLYIDIREKKQEKLYISIIKSSNFWAEPKSYTFYILIYNFLVFDFLLYNSIKYKQTVFLVF